MNQKIITENAILTHQIILPNEDGILDFFTQKHGNITVFCKKFGLSRKRKQEIDFFRLIEITYQKKRTNFQLKEAHAQIIFRNIVSTYSLYEKVSSWIKLIRHCHFDNHADDFFETLTRIFQAVQDTSKEEMEAIFFANLLYSNGLIPLNMDQPSRLMTHSSWRTLRYIIQKPIKNTLQILDSIPQENFREIINISKKIIQKNLS